MPAGLDGNPNRVVTPQRTEVLSAIVDAIRRREEGRTLVGLDGRPGSGKSTLGDEVAALLRQQGEHVVRSTTDSFHRPRAERGRLGPTSAGGYYRDSHRLDEIVETLLLPFRSGSTQIRTSAFDEPSDRELIIEVEVPANCVLVFDGLFVQRPDFAPFWDVSVFLIADRRLDAAWLEFLEHDLPSDPSSRASEIDKRLRRARWPRYRSGWQLYFDEVKPEVVADLVIDNNDFESPNLAGTRPGR